LAVEDKNRTTGGEQTSPMGGKTKDRTRGGYMIRVREGGAARNRATKSRSRRLMLSEKHKDKVVSGVRVENKTNQNNLQGSTKNQKATTQEPFAHRQTHSLKKKKSGNSFSGLAVGCSYHSKEMETCSIIVERSG